MTLSFHRRIEKPVRAMRVPLLIPALFCAAGVWAQTHTVTLHNYVQDSQVYETTVPADVGQPLPSGIPAPSREGYVFAGYFAQAQGLGTQYYAADMTPMAAWDVPGDTSIFAHWCPQGTAVSVLRFNNGIESRLCWERLPVALGAQMPPISARMTPPTRPGYTFAGYWGAPAYQVNDSPIDWWNGGGTMYYDENLAPTVQAWDKDIAGVVILYARWTSAWTHADMLCLDHNDGSGTMQYIHGNTIYMGQPLPTWGTEWDTPLAMPTREGYTFMGFFENPDGTGAQYIAQDLSTLGMAVWNQEKGSGEPGWTIYARWLPSATVTVNFTHQGGGGNPGNPIPTSKTVTVGAPYGALATFPNGVVLGWFTTPDFQPGTRVTEESFVTLTGNHTLYALTANNNHPTHMVYFDPNGGAFMGNPGVKAIHYPNGSYTFSQFGLPVPDYRPGYAFVGWSLNASGGPLFDTSGNVPNGNDVYLYAQWSVVPVSGNPWEGWLPPPAVNDLGSYYRGQVVNIPLGGAAAGNALLFYVSEAGILPFNLHIDPETGEVFGQVALDEALGDYYFDVTIYAENDPAGATRMFKLTIIEAPTGDDPGAIRITAIRLYAMDLNEAMTEMVEIEAIGCTNPNKSYAVFGHREEISARFGAGSRNAEIQGTRKVGTGDSTGYRVYVFPKPIDPGSNTPYNNHFFHVREIDE